MAVIDPLFATPIYRDELGDDALVEELATACRTIAADDVAGQRWSAKHGYPGYTSYASLADLPWRSPPMKTLAKRLDRHAAAFARTLDYDLGRSRLALAGLWINLLPPGGLHGSHLHPNAVLSGTVYVVLPPGSDAIRFEDPRLAMTSGAPPRKAKPRPENRRFVTVRPQPGTVLLWESFLRHEVPLNRSEDERISISFNYARG